MKKLLMLFCCLLPVVLQAQVISTIAGTGTAGNSGDGSLAVLAEIRRPNSLAFDNAENLYICDYANCSIRKINSSGIISTVAGNGTCGYSGDNGPATLAQIFAPDAVTVDFEGNIYISTAGDHRIRKTNVAGIITTIAGDGTAGYNGDNIAATSAKLFYPYVGAVDNIGNVYFSDYNNHRVRKINTSGIISTIAGNGSSSYSGDGGAATAAGLRGPCWLFLTPAGDLYIPDNISYCVRKVSANGIITTFAGTGVSGYTGDGSAATSARLMYPNSLAIDKFGNAFIADLNAHVIRKVTPDGVINTIAGTGSAGFNGDNINATSAQLNNPNYVLANPSGNILIADYNNHRIRKITYHSETVNDINNVLQHVSIYPNPAHNEITVTWEGGTVQTGNEIIIVNIAGQAVISECNTGSTVTLYTGKLPAGMYLVTVNGAYAGRFVKE